MCQWIHGYSLEESDFFCIVRTFAGVFPHIQLWCVHHYDYLLIGSDAPLKMTIEKLRERLAQERVLPLLKQIHFDTEEEFLACFMSTDAELRSIATANKYPIHTDDNMLLEFSAPRALYKQENPLQSTHFETDPEELATLAALKSDGPFGRADSERRIDLSAAGRLQARCAFEGAGDKLNHWFAASLLAPKQHWVLEDKQRELLTGPNRRVILNCTRQWGKSWMAAVALLFHSVNHPDSVSLVAGPTLRQSAELLKKVKDLAARMGLATKRKGPGGGPRMLKEHESSSPPELRFACVP